MSGRIRPVFQQQKRAFSFGSEIYTALGKTARKFEERGVSPGGSGMSSKEKIWGLTNLVNWNW